MNWTDWTDTYFFVQKDKGMKYNEVFHTVIVIKALYMLEVKPSTVFFVKCTPYFGALLPQWHSVSSRKLAKLVGAPEQSHRVFIAKDVDRNSKILLGNYVLLEHTVDNT